MSGPGTVADQEAGFPAPGSDVPGAPPMLRRALTEADGHIAADSPGRITPLPESESRSFGGADVVPAVTAQDHGQRAVLVRALMWAAGLLGAAAGLELQRARERRRWGR